MDTDKLLAALETLRRVHYMCDEDVYYSCPAVDYEGNLLDETNCDCGALKHNARIDTLIGEIKHGIKG